MPRGRSQQDTATLQMALVGYEVEKKKIEERIRELQAILKGNQPSIGLSTDASGPAPRKRRRLSAEARKRIAAAQKKRWAEHRKRMGQAG